MTYRLLMVCTGNICRSAMAEIVVRDRLEEAGINAYVDSAGISDEEHGGPIDYRAQRTLTRAGYQVPHHQARQVQGHELGTYDLVLAMTSHHLSVLEHLAQHAGVDVDKETAVGAPKAVDIRMFREFDPTAPAVRHRRELDVPDPWYGDQEDFEETLRTIESAADSIVEHVARAQG
ncbi:MAG: low molecular weight protein-tyrosine-phosphatase [Actinomycetaceae bacterium]|nr:low molecular weight protein-tyrosine-phosphatase [Actinomycetaceae bacterium]